MSPLQYTFLGFFLIGFFLTLYFVKNNKKLNVPSIVCFGIIGGVVSVAFRVILLTICLMIEVPVKWSEHYSSTKLISMKDQNSMYGSFFLGSGQIGNEDYYKYYYEYDGGYKKGTLYPNRLSGRMSEVIIFEEDRKDGELRVFKLEYSEAWHNFIFTETVSLRYEFHIPKGTIARGFELK